jgi:hypothetical protein
MFQALRTIVLAAVACTLCACAPNKSFTSQAVARGDDCKGYAAGQAMDAYADHYAGESAQSIYDHAYRDCIAWRKDHPSVPPSPGTSAAGQPERQ